MKTNEIKDLLKFIDSTNLTSVKLDLEGIKLEVSKTNSQVEYKYAEKSEATDFNYQEEISAEREVEVHDDEKTSFVVAPLIGTFYASPSPQDENFVKIGDIVEIGDTLCILEAMKLMNEITSEVRGEVIDILVKNEDLVEYDQPLFKIKSF
ncbi:acetyl-CoA carboxylase biotin carboxyl carrier protein [Romboutsia weinsteinii]|uniref:Biotin carboxyl carrier protein of acetyl-CoA carboxylase n=1 Tax=Romboutsia weinsteinii TaxID=2020949 RepID=A0A371J6G5_9FIRM|nr:acetyl-CoA carboxylase biotin carboxyl carrier protein [Romboutsia weinsteinii]RDY28335.1 acetyl-CoA carboxylase biotin carboxyl carrier protein [Romboutsia weinsteinii]